MSEIELKKFYLGKDRINGVLKGNKLNIQIWDEIIALFARNDIDDNTVLLNTDFRRKVVAKLEFVRSRAKVTEAINLFVELDLLKKDTTRSTFIINPLVAFKGHICKHLPATQVYYYNYQPFNYQVINLFEEFTSLNLGEFVVVGRKVDVNIGRERKEKVLEALKHI